MPMPNVLEQNNAHNFALFLWTKSRRICYPY